MHFQYTRKELTVGSQSDANVDMLLIRKKYFDGFRANHRNNENGSSNLDDGEGSFIFNRIVQRQYPRTEISMGTLSAG